MTTKSEELDIKTSKDIDAFSIILRKLNAVGSVLRVLSIFIISMTATNLITLLYIISPLYDRTFYELSYFVNIFPLLMIIIVFLSSLLFDLYRRKGKAYYDEITEEMHGKALNSNKSSDENDSKSMEARLAMRQYMNAMDIPLLPGKYGPVIIIGLNIACVLIFFPFH